MLRATKTSQIFRFGVFELDVEAGELRKRGLRLPIQGRALQILAALLETPGTVVSREQLRKLIWPADTFVDFDHSLHNGIARLREVLGDSVDSPRFIETIPRRGYRFVASVEDASRPPGATETVTEPEVIHPGPPARWWPIGMLAAGILIVMVAIIYLREHRTAQKYQITSLAVLPLRNLSGDPEQEYFADGTTEELITSLARISALRVISHTSVAGYKDTKKPLPEIARELKVDAIIEGTVARSGNRFRITANLVQAFPEKHLWAESYERDLGDVLSLQSELAQAVTHEIRVKLTPIETSRLATTHRVNPEAYELYLRGRYFWNKRTKEGLKKALEYFHQAVAIEPNYALAYAAIAECYLPSAYLGYSPPNEALPKARTAAVRALEIDEALAEAHSALAAEKEFYEWDWAGAEKEFQRAIELNPGYATAHSWYAQYLVSTGRMQEALAESKHALQFDPFSLVINLGFAHRLYWMRQYDQAIDQGRKTLSLDPSYSPETWSVALAYEQKGQCDGAIATLRIVKSSQRNAFTLASFGHIYALCRNASAARAIIRELEGRSQKEYVDPYAVALVYAGLEQNDEAFAWLQKASQQHSPLFTFLEVEPMLDPLRIDPRFQELLRRVGLKE
jgi:TolB-like protein/DNA-binding winged helix-turn-helix (wHTH) protein/Tfp pilus assembly protein PilF